MNLCRLAGIWFSAVLMAAVQITDSSAQMRGAKGLRDGPRGQRPGLDRPAVAVERPDLPEGWIDTHIHLRGRGNYGSALESALRVMERVGLRVSIVMPQPFPGDSQNPNTHEYEDFLEPVRSSHGRFAFLGGGGSLNGMIERAHRDGNVTAELLQAFEAQAEEIRKLEIRNSGEILGTPYLIIDFWLTPP